MLYQPLQNQDHYLLQCCTYLTESRPILTAVLNLPLQNEDRYLLQYWTYPAERIPLLTAVLNLPLQNEEDRYLLQCCMRSVCSFLHLWMRDLSELPFTLRQKLMARHSRWIQLLESNSMWVSSTKLMPYRLTSFRLGVWDLILLMLITS